MRSAPGQIAGRVGRRIGRQMQGSSPGRRMTGRDRSVVGGLLLAFAILAGATILPAGQPPEPSASVPAATPIARGYREGIVGQPSSVNPLTARTNADRAIVALVFSGLVRLGPDGTIVPDLAERWTVDDTGAAYIFELRKDAVWHDGTPVTAADVVFTVRALRDPGYDGPAATSWREVTATEIDPHTVRLDLATPLGGFLEAATQRIAPAHLLEGIPVDQLADQPFNQQPVGTGPFRLVSWHLGGARLEPTVSTLDTGPVPEPVASVPLPTDTIASPPPTPRPRRPLPYLPWIELRFFARPGDLVAAYEAGEVDSAAGLPPREASALATTQGSQLLRYPRATLTTVTFDLRVARPEFRDPRVRRALLGAIDRRAMIESVLAGQAIRADSPIPPSSWAFDGTISTEVAFDAAAARRLLLAAGWTKVDGRWAVPGAGQAYKLELIAPDLASSPIAWATAEAVAADWRAFGFDVELAGLPASEFVTDRLRVGKFAAAVVDVNLGLDPDLYSLMASSQTGSDGSNVAGLQNPALDVLLVAARAPGDEATRKAAYGRLQALLAEQQYLLPLFFRDEPVVVRSTIEGPTVRQIADPSDRFWDVLTWRLATSR